MKTLKIIGLTLFTIIVLLFIGGLFISPKVHVERNAVINASPEKIFPNINTLSNWTKWSPWHTIDSNMIIVYTGPESGAGASYAWKSNNGKVGSGKMTIVQSMPNSFIATQMDFMENGTAIGTFRLEPGDIGTKVTWTMDSDMGFNPFARYMGLMMDKWVGEDFEKGLENLEKASK